MDFSPRRHYYLDTNGVGNGRNLIFLLLADIFKKKFCKLYNLHSLQNIIELREITRCSDSTTIGGCGLKGSSGCNIIQYDYTR